MHRNDHGQRGSVALGRTLCKWLRKPLIPLLVERCLRMLRSLDLPDVLQKLSHLIGARESS